MKKIYRLISVFFLTALLGLGLAGCAKEEFKVEFMVQNDKNAWVTFQDKKVEEGKVELVEAPAKTYYTFTGWFNEETLTTPFENKEIKSNLKVYAKYTPVEVKVVINGEEPLTKNLVDVVNATYNPGEGLEFNGWYTDAALKVKWNGKEVVETLYADSIALVTFNDGYKDVYIAEVKPGQAIANPAEQKVKVEEVETTVEKANILQDYMSEKNISYVDEKGQAIDFSKPITKSQTITVLWNSKFNASNYKLNEKTGNYYLETTSSFGKVPVVSILSDVTIETEESTAADAPKVEKDIHVEAFLASTINLIDASTKKIIIGEGIKTIKGLSSTGASSVENVVIPTTAEIIDNSFNNMPLVKEFNIPEGVKVIISSFWGKSGNDFKTHRLGSASEAVINVPASVVNMAMVPTNFKFAEGSTFAKENGYIFQTTSKGKVLIADPNASLSFNDSGISVADTIVVPACDGIQAGTYDGIFNYLVLPETFKFVNYNEKMSDYKHYVFEEGSSSSICSNMLFDENAKDPSVTMAPNAYAISSYLNGLNIMGQKFTGSGKIVFATESLPTELAKTAFTTDPTGWAVATGKYSPMVTIVKDEADKDKEVINPSVLFKNNDVKAYFTLTFPGFSTVSLTLTGDQLNNLTAEAVRDQLVGKIEGLSEQQLADIQSCKVMVKENNKAIELGSITKTSYMTVEIVSLVISGAYRLSVGENFSTADDASTYWMAMEEGSVMFMFNDLTKLSKENILAAVLDEATKLMVPNYDYEATEEQIKANLKWSYDNAVSVKILVNGEEVTDFSKINLDNGSVTINVVYEFKEYGM